MTGKTKCNSDYIVRKLMFFLLFFVLLTHFLHLIFPFKQSRQFFLPSGLVPPIWHFLPSKLSEPDPRSWNWPKNLAPWKNDLLRKTVKYQELQSLITTSSNGEWKPFLLTIEVGAKGFVSYSVSSCLKKLGIHGSS